MEIGGEGKGMIGIGRGLGGVRTGLSNLKKK